MKGWHNKTLFLTIAWLLLVPAVAQVVVLRDTVNVSSQVVRLSDLLPRDASVELRRVAETIELGRGPKIGSMRVFERASVAETLNTHPEFRRAVIPDRILVTRPGHAISSTAIHDAIANFFHDRGSTDLADWTFPQPNGITAAETNPQIEVRSSNWNPSTGQIEFLLRCVKPQACQDFLVFAKPPDRAVAHYPQLLRDRATSLPDQPNASPILVKPGRRMALLIQGDGLQISAKVICLQSGRQGDMIRVRQIGSPHIFLAKIMSHDLLWSELES